MSDFKAKMYQIQFLLGVRPRPRWGSLQHSPDPLAGLRGHTSKGRGRDTEGEGRVEGEGGDRKERGSLREGMGLVPSLPPLPHPFTPPSIFLDMSLPLVEHLVPGLFIPKYFRSRKLKVYRQNIRSANLYTQVASHVIGEWQM